MSYIEATGVHTELVWTPEAWDQFGEMRSQAARIHQNWGQQLGDRAFASIGICLMGVLAAGPTRVYKDHDGLLFQTPHITMGMVFHPDSAQYMADHIEADATADEIEACFRFAPRSGEWSLHS